MEELLDHADETFEGLLDSQENLADPLDRATFESDRIRTLRIRDRDSMLIKKNPTIPEGYRKWRIWYQCIERTKDEIHLSRIM